MRQELVRSRKSVRLSTCQTHSHVTRGIVSSDGYIFTSTVTKYTPTHHDTKAQAIAYGVSHLGFNIEICPSLVSVIFDPLSHIIVRRCSEGANTFLFPAIQHQHTCSVDVWVFISWLGSQEFVTDRPRRCLGERCARMCVFARVFVCARDASAGFFSNQTLCCSPVSCCASCEECPCILMYLVSPFRSVTVSLSPTPMLNFICLSHSHLTSPPLLSIQLLFSHSVPLALFIFSLALPL